jgi:hypothetical protein
MVERSSPRSVSNLDGIGSQFCCPRGLTMGNLLNIWLISIRRGILCEIDRDKVQILLILCIVAIVWPLSRISGVHEPSEAAGVSNNGPYDRMYRRWHLLQKEEECLESKASLSLLIPRLVAHVCSAEAEGQIDTRNW